jgi:outer membrane lipoprotein-sorting protein
MKWILATALAGGLATVSLAAVPVATPRLTAAEIVAKNAVARGGADAWQKMQTMVWSGHTESEAAPDRKLPFLLELKRPGRVRFEIATPAGRSLRIYDGSNGWKLRPNSAGLPELQPYTDAELAFARGAQIIDGPLMDYAAKRAAISIAGTTQIDGRDAYLLDAKLPNGDSGRLWIDAETFLEARHDRTVGDGASHQATSTMSYHDYRQFEGLKVALVIETGAASGKGRDKLVIEKIALNPPIDDKTFAKPSIATPRHGGVMIDTRSAAAAAAGPPPLAPAR